MSPVLLVTLLVLWVLVLFNMLLTFALLRRVNRMTASSMQANTVDRLKVGEPAPDFSAQALDGETVNLSTYAGRRVVFIFVSPTCRPCREALPTYEDLLPKAQRSGTSLILVSVAAAFQTRSFAEELQISIPLLVAPRETNPFMTDYKILGTPSYCSVDERGMVQSVGYPGLNESEWQVMVESWEEEFEMAPEGAVAVGGR